MMSPHVLDVVQLLEVHSIAVLPVGRRFLVVLLGGEDIMGVVVGF